MIIFNDLTCYTVNECAAILETTSPALRRHISSGHLKALKNDGVYLVNEFDLKEFADRRRKKRKKKY